MNTRKIGEALENYICYELEMNKTKGSGSVKHDGDLKDNDLFIVECKYRNKNNISISKEWLDEIKKQAELSEREWMFINQTSDKSIYVTIDFEVFKELYNAFKNNKYTTRNKPI